MTKKNVDFHVNEAIILNSEQVLWFRLGEDYFENKQNEALGLQDGFYHVLFENEVFSFYAKRRKERRLDDREVKIVSDDQFYIIRKDELFKVRKTTNLYKVFPEIKDSLKAYCRTLGVKKLADASTNRLTELAIQCDKLLKEP